MSRSRAHARWAQGGETPAQFLNAPLQCLWLQRLHALPVRPDPVVHSWTHLSRPHCMSLPMQRPQALLTFCFFLMQSPPGPALAPVCIPQLYMRLPKLVFHPRLLTQALPVTCSSAEALCSCASTASISPRSWRKCIAQSPSITSHTSSSTRAAVTLSSALACTTNSVNRMSFAIIAANGDWGAWFRFDYAQTA